MEKVGGLDEAQLCGLCTAHKGWRSILVLICTGSGSQMRAGSCVREEGHAPAHVTHVWVLLLCCVA